MSKKMRKMLLVACTCMAFVAGASTVDRVVFCKQPLCDADTTEHERTVLKPSGYVIDDVAVANKLYEKLVNPKRGGRFAFLGQTADLVFESNGVPVLVATTYVHRGAFRICANSHIKKNIDGGYEYAGKWHEPVIDEEFVKIIAKAFRKFARYELPQGSSSFPDERSRMMRCNVRFIDQDSTMSTNTLRFVWEVSHRGERGWLDAPDFSWLKTCPDISRLELRIHPQENLRALSLASLPCLQKLREFEFHASSLIVDDVESLRRMTGLRKLVLSADVAQEFISWEVYWKPIEVLLIKSLEPLEGMGIEEADFSGAMLMDVTSLSYLSAGVAKLSPPVFYRISDLPVGVEVLDLRYSRQALDGPDFRFSTPIIDGSKKMKCFKRLKEIRIRCEDVESEMLFKDSGLSGVRIRKCCGGEKWATCP